MSLRIRQIVLVARVLEQTVNDLRAALGVRVAYRDPQVAEFGLHNALMPVGDQFVEVVSPTQTGTTAGRLLERRGGDSGYMIILQTDDLDRDRARIDRLGVRVIWSANHDDIRAIHLHPKDIGGAIVSLDQPTPPTSWRWAGPDWQKFVTRDSARRILEAEIEANDPEGMARRWAQVLGLDDPMLQDGAWRLAVTDGALRFVQAGARGDGLSGFTIAVTSPDEALAHARPRGLPMSDHVVIIGGAQFRLVPPSRHRKAATATAAHEAQNRQFKLASRPVGMVKRSNFDFTVAPIPEPGPGEVLIKVLYLSVDPAMRGWMNEGRSYIRPVAIGEVMRAGGVGRVIASNAPDIAVGDTVTATTGVQDYAVLKADDVTKVDSNLAPITQYLGALGMTGMTAYFGLLDVGHPKAGETVVVSAAAGAVGGITGQIAKIKGCRVVGVAGGEDKCRYIVDELGFDAAVDYKLGDLRKRLREQCPNGIDVFFDNVGGEVLEAALACLARHARVVLCGAISQYNARDSLKGPRNYMSLLINRARMEGFVVFDYAGRFGEAVKDMAGWMAEGKLKAREDIVAGLDTFPCTLLKLFRGENTGKLLIRVAD